MPSLRNIRDDDDEEDAIQGPDLTFPTDDRGGPSDAFMEELQSSFGEIAASVDMSTLASGVSGSCKGTMQTDDLLALNILCACAKAPSAITEEARLEAQYTWQPVREWLARFDAVTGRAAAEQRGESGLSALHFAGRNVPPQDVIEVFMSIAADTVRWLDAFGWLPIHYACATGADTAIIRILVEHYPESRTITDSRGRTPLHFAFCDRPATADVVLLLGNSHGPNGKSSAAFKDAIGMLVSKTRKNESMIAAES